MPCQAVVWRDGTPGVIVEGTWRALDLEALTPTDAIVKRGLTAGERVSLPGEARS